jgi:hypothetical protein
MPQQFEQMIRDTIGNAIMEAFSKGMPVRKYPDLEKVSDAFLRSMPESEYDAAVLETERNADTAIEIAGIIHQIVRRAARGYGVSID